MSLGRQRRVSPGQQLATTSPAAGLESQGLQLSVHTQRPAGPGLKPLILTGSGNEGRSCRREGWSVNELTGAGGGARPCLLTLLLPMNLLPSPEAPDPCPVLSSQE